MPDQAEGMSHPRFPEWIAEMNILQNEAGVPADECLPFDAWLKDKKEQEARPIPRIKTELPPRSRIEQLKIIDDKYRDFQILLYGMVTITIIVELLAAAFGALWLVIILIVAAVIAWSIYFKDADQKIKAEGAELRKPIFLDAYNTDFTCPLADRSVIRLTVHFQIPRELNMPSIY